MQGQEINKVMKETILKTEILFSDLHAEKLGMPEKEVWGSFYLDLNEVAGFGDYVKDNQVYSDVTEVTLKNIGGRVINISVAEFKKLMEKVWK